MAKIKIITLYLIFLISNSALTINFYSEEESDLAKKNGSLIGIATVRSIAGSYTNTGSAMVYKFNDRIVGITCAHTFDRAIASNEHAIKTWVSFNQSINNVPFRMEANVNIHPQYQQAKSLFEQRDPQYVKNDIAIFTLPTFPKELYEKLLDLNLGYQETTSNEYGVMAYSYGPCCTTVEKKYDIRNSPQSAAVQIYRHQNGNFQDNYSSKEVILIIDLKNHNIEFEILVNERGRITSIPGDSGSNLIEKQSNILIAMFTHHDYMDFFIKKSALARFYNQYVISKIPSQERTDEFLNKISEFGRIHANEEIITADKKYIFFQSHETITASTLFTPLYPHKKFIMDFIDQSLPSVLKPIMTYLGPVANK